MQSTSTSEVEAIGLSNSKASGGLFQKMLMRVLGRFKIGRLQIDLPDGSSRILGSSEDESFCARIQVNDPVFFKKCALYGNVGLGESYMDGDWDTPDICAVISWFVVNLQKDPVAQGSSQRFRLAGILRVFDRIRHKLRRNTKANSRRNIEEHYDLGNDFYKLWLDPTMTYSAAKWVSADQTLEEAQHEKYDALCRKMELNDNHHVLEIGCGWGGFSIHAASNYGCRVTAVTISPSQHKEASQRVKDAGLEHLVEIRLQDYRDITGKFDRIASIEMLEAVGDQYLETWCSKCHEVLADDGMLAVQMITVPDKRHAQLKKGADFIQKHIFPGSLLLAVGRMNEAINKTGDLFLHHLEDLGSSYSRTLKEWYDNFNEKLEEVKQLGFSERFVRKWNYYLKYCEAAFATRNISVVHGVYTRPSNHPSLHREDGTNLTG